MAAALARSRTALVIGALLAIGGCAGGAVTTTVPTPTLAPSAPTPTSLPPSPAATATAALAWEQLATVPVPRSIVGIAASPAGYVVLSWPRTAWFSVDGRTWTSAQLPFEPATSSSVRLVTLDKGNEIEAQVNAIVGGQGGFVAVGSYTLPPCSDVFTPGGAPACEIAPISWSSADGRTWQSSLPTPIPADGSGLPRYSELVDAWPAGDAWNAAVSVIADTPVSRGNAVLRSTDGLSWTRLEPAPLPDGTTSGDGVYRHAGIAAADGRLLTWQVTMDSFGVFATTLSTFNAGTDWRRIDQFDGAGVRVTRGLPPAAGTDPWLLAGSARSGDPSTVRWWRSDDLVTWRSGTMPIALDGQQGFSALGRSHGYMIALGMRADPCCRATGTWLSRDGEAWIDAGGLAGPTFMADGPAGLVGVALAEDGTSAVVWLGVFPGMKQAS